MTLHGLRQLLASHGWTLDTPKLERNIDGSWHQQIGAIRNADKAYRKIADRHLDLLSMTKTEVLEKLY